VDEDQLSLAIGRNGQNVRLASQLIGWQIDLYGSREWLERGADALLFGAGKEAGNQETSDFPLSELEIPEDALAALEAAGYSTFLEIIDLDENDFRGVEGLTEEAVVRLIEIIDELTVLDESESDPEVVDEVVDEVVSEEESVAEGSQGG
jgi:N utilization substance protein A